MSKETFKAFARSHPELATSVMKNNATWQKLYELYEIYGENSQVWDGYFSKTTSLSDKTTAFSSSFKDLFNTVKNVDLESVKKGVNNLQKTIGLLQDIGFSTTASKTPTYEPRPIHKYFED